MKINNKVWQPAAGGVVAVTGGCGFIGSYLVRHLLAMGLQVNILDDLSTGLSSNLPQSKNISLRIGSVLNPKAIQDVTHNADLVVHLASVVGMNLAVDDPDYAFAISREGTQCVVDNSGSTPILLFSSSSVYGLHNTAEPMCEAQKISRDDALQYDGGIEGYATGKWELERVGQKSSADGRSVMIIRPFNVVGPGQSAAYGMVLPNFVNRALHGLSLFVHDDGRQSRSFCDIGTFIDSVWCLLQTDAAWTPGANVINIGKSELTSILDLAKMVMKETGNKVPIEYVPYHKVFPGKKDVRTRIPTTNHLQSLIGSVDWQTIREIVRESVSYELSMLNEVPSESTVSCSL